MGYFNNNNTAENPITPDNDRLLLTHVCSTPLPMIALLSSPSLSRLRYKKRPWQSRWLSGVYLLGFLRRPVVFSP